MAAKDAVEVAPHVYKSVIENDRVRVLESKMAPGSSTEMHHHPAVVAVALTNAKVRFTLGDGQTMEAELKEGDSMYLEAVDHATENIGDNDIHVMLVELK